MTMAHVFQYDWFTGNIPTFQKHLAHLRGQPCHVLEIGSHEGRSSTWLLENILTHPQARLTSVEPYLQPTFWDNIRASGGEAKTSVIQKFSREALRELPLSSFDFIYVDGSHWTVDVLEDAVFSFRLAKVGAIIGFDDYLWDDPGYNQEGTPKPAIDAFLNVYAKKIKVLQKEFQVWVRKLAD
jgi:predicted O-methyltransferase YrrM